MSSNLPIGLIFLLNPIVAPIDGDIFITNVTTTYEDIPKYCNLVGAEFDQDYPANTICLNITDDETFWIGATDYNTWVYLHTWL
jgi:hypothetical protein